MKHRLLVKVFWDRTLDFVSSYTFHGAYKTLKNKVSPERGEILPKRTSRGEGFNGWLWLLLLLITIITLVCGHSQFVGTSNHELLFTPIAGYPPGWHEWYGPVSVLIVPEFPLIGTLAPIIVVAVALMLYKSKIKLAL